MKANRKFVGDEEGTFGIGTMIIFIAMIVVAVVAATVIIETMNKLQATAKNTGDQAVQQVSAGVRMMSAIGSRRTGAFAGFPILGRTMGGVTQTLPGGERKASDIQEISLYLALRPGSLPVDLDRTVINLVTPRDVILYMGSPRRSENARSFEGISQIRDDDDSIKNSHVLNNMRDFAAVTLDISDLEIGAGETFTVQITPDTGGLATTASITLPLTYPSRTVQVQLYP